MWRAEWAVCENNWCGTVFSVEMWWRLSRCERLLWRSCILGSIRLWQRPRSNTGIRLLLASELNEASDGCVVGGNWTCVGDLISALTFLHHRQGLSYMAAKFPWLYFLKIIYITVEPHLWTRSRYKWNYHLEHRSTKSQTAKEYTTDTTKSCDDPPFRNPSNQSLQLSAVTVSKPSLTFTSVISSFLTFLGGVSQRLWISSINVSILACHS